MADDLRVEFDASIQTLSALQAAAYRLLDMASCQIEQQGGRFVCRLTLRATRPGSEQPEPESMRGRFIDLVTDENLRERVADKTAGVRNVILSLAFGALANESR